MIFRDYSLDAQKLKFLDFVFINIWHVQLKPFFKKKDLIICKTEKKILTVWASKGLWKFIFKLKFLHIFGNISYFFNLNLQFACSELSFDVYNMSFGQNLQFFIFYYKISINNQVLSATSHG